MSLATNRYQFPYPDLLDTPNVPRDMGALAQAVETQLAAIDAKAAPKRIRCGSLAAPGAIVLNKITLGYKPQLVVIRTLYPVGSIASYAEGRLGIDVNGATVQMNTGLRVSGTSGGQYDRNLLTDSCAGFINPSGGVLAKAVGAFVADGFTLDVKEASTGATYYWEAYE